ncbi:GNAT family N-acetyltransferase [Bacillus thermotolerans]|uniref:GNAT family N-acetyltransferase n=1 Tax=Bacillus thermotolerans TaxID=1221996 RepID=UPI00057EB1F1|nr:GNAT family N-acetyltransferase [Bacillus thermotolerans]KKB37564.1 Acetyltransferase AcuA, acetyl-CoA synthetase inhibitor [Bacillus thermotolerans]KKB42207.1 Acetyltransferase AcuA, acetyl-CoA synthetase inhibitor [Bacillus thermotolerans]
MEHKKEYHSQEIESPEGTLVIEGPVSSETLSRLTFHEGLSAFRIPDQQHKALIEIAGLPEGRIIIARNGEEIIGYVTFLYPDPLERWSEANLEELLELGAVEVAPAYRGMRVGKNMLQLSMRDKFMENYIIITTEYYWHWDLKGTGLNVWEYRKMMERMMNAGGLTWFATDDPEISSHPANCLMVRIGKNIDEETIQKFDQIRFVHRFMY